MAVKSAMLNTEECTGRRGLPVFTLSPSLRPAGDREARGPAPDGTPLAPEVPSRWRFVGVAQYHEFPASVMSGATGLSRSGGG